jgi:oligopeptide transport system substrate-binding protein
LVATGMSLEKALASLPPPERGERRNIHVYPTFGTDYYSFNCRSTLQDGRDNPFHDARVRRAFVMAVDKQAIVNHATRLREPVATTFIPPGSIPGYTSPKGLAHDPAAARKELLDAGWVDRDGDGALESASGLPFPVIDLLYTTNTPRYKWISLMLKDQWERELGVQVELRGADTKFYKEDLRQGKFMIGRSRWYGDYGDPTTFLDLNRSTDGNNDRGFNSPRYDAMLDAASAQEDPATRMAMLSACEALLVEEELPILPICQLVQVYMFEPGTVSGLTTHPRLVQFLDQVKVSK